MPAQRGQAVLDKIRDLVFCDSACSDTLLLGSFLTQRDEAAFHALVRRHGPMVLGVCRRMLGSLHDAEDAFQAVFLVLARKASSIQPRSMLGNWLYGVAYRAALKLRANRTTRQTREKQVITMPESRAVAPTPDNDLAPVLDEELSRLPDHHRLPIVLCDLEGKTYREAAQQLGWPEGTLSVRLARGRKTLAARLTRRGITAPTAAIAAMLAHGMASASVPSSLIASTTKPACAGGAAAAAAPGLVSATALSLADGLVKAMLVSKLKTIACLVLVLGLIVACWASGLRAGGSDTAESPPEIIFAGGGKPGGEAKEGAKPGAVFKAPGSHTHDVALSPDGKILARAGTGKCDLWDVASGKILHTLKGQPHFYKVAFSPDGKTLAAITGNVAADKFEVEVKLWDVATGKERVLGKGHLIGALSMAFSPDGKTLATSSMKTVKLWDVATGKEKMELGGVWGSLAFSPDGKTLAVGDSSVHIWDLTTGKKRVSLARPGDWLDVRPFAYSDVLGFSSDGKTLVSAGLHKGKDDPNTLHAQLTLWDVATAKEQPPIAIPGYSAPNAPPFVFTADGKTLVTAVWIFEKDKATAIGRVSVQHSDLATGKARATYWTPVNPGGNHPEAGHVVGFYFAALSADGKTVAWGGAEGPEKGFTGTAHVWEVQSLATSPPKIPKEVEEKDKEAAEERKDVEDLRGTWKLRAAEINGRRKDPKHLQTQMQIDWSVLELDTPEGLKGASYRIDVSRRPKTIDMVSEGKWDRRSHSALDPGLSTGKFAGRKITVKAIYRSKEIG